jgi:membrane protease YdiL (CAAX protease family)
MPEEPLFPFDTHNHRGNGDPADSGQHIGSEFIADSNEGYELDRPVARFCTRCGTPLDTPEAVCIKCFSPDLPSMGQSGGEIEFEAIPVASSIWLYFLLLGSILLAMVLGLLEVLTDVQMEFMGTIGITLIVIIWVVKHYKLVLKELTHWDSGKWYVWAVLASVGTFGFATVYINFISGSLELEAYSYSEDFLVAGYGWFMVFLVVCVQPAIFEELAFRGVIFGSLKKVLNTREVILVTALMFMILHLNLIAFPFLFIIGLILGVLREKSQSLYPCILMHFTHNLLVILEEARIEYVG